MSESNNQATPVPNFVKLGDQVYEKMVEDPHKQHHPGWEDETLEVVPATTSDPTPPRGRSRRVASAPAPSRNRRTEEEKDEDDEDVEQVEDIRQNDNTPPRRSYPYTLEEHRHIFTCVEEIMVEKERALNMVDFNTVAEHRNDWFCHRRVEIGEKLANGREATYAYTYPKRNANALHSYCTKPAMNGYDYQILLDRLPERIAIAKVRAERA